MTIIANVEIQDGNRADALQKKNAQVAKKSKANLNSNSFVLEQGKTRKPVGKFTKNKKRPVSKEEDEEEEEEEEDAKEEKEPNVTLMAV